MILIDNNDTISVRARVEIANLKYLQWLEVAKWLIISLTNISHLKKQVALRPNTSLMMYIISKYLSTHTHYKANSLYVNNPLIYQKQKMKESAHVQHKI